MRHVLLACALLLTLYTPASDDKPLPLPKVSISPVAVVAVVNVVEVAAVSRGQRTINMEATAYCSCSLCCDTATGITASGEVASEITVAADWDVLPAGTWVQIEGIGRRVVQDRGGAIRGNRIDLWFSSHEAALNFGRRTVKVIIE